MTAMITEARRVTIRGTMAENAAIIGWVAENCPKAALDPSFSSDLTQVILTFDDDAELAKFKLAHSDEFNERSRREAEYRNGTSFQINANTFRISSLSAAVNAALSPASLPHDEEEDDD